MLEAAKSASVKKASKAASKASKLATAPAKPASGNKDAPVDESEIATVHPVCKSRAAVRFHGDGNVV